MLRVFLRLLRNFAGANVWWADGGLRFIRLLTEMKTLNVRSVWAAVKGHPQVRETTAYAILFTMGVCHLLNDMIQSIIPAIYPLLKDRFGFTFAQIGLITFVFQLTSSVFQPVVGQLADRRPQPYSLAAGMCLSLVGLLMLAFAPSFGVILLSVAVIGGGSSVFHPEASRVAQLASGGR